MDNGAIEREHDVFEIKRRLRRATVAYAAANSELTIDKNYT
jgi:hypothetical protein